MADLTKTAGTVLLAWTAFATTEKNVGGAQDVSSKFAAAFDIRMIRQSGTAFSAGWPNFRIEGSAKDAGNDAWAELISYQPPVGANIANTTLNGAILAEATSCVVTVNTNIAVGDKLGLGHTTDPTKYEIVRVAAVAGTTITFEEACTYAHDTGAQVTDQAEVWRVQLAFDACTRVRFVADNIGGGQTMACRCIMTTLDAIA